jgi:hypothetical protein
VPEKSRKVGIPQDCDTNTDTELHQHKCNQHDIKIRPLISYTGLGGGGGYSELMH